jgi:HEPN domain-containing protein
MCHQVIEKSLKGVFVSQNPETSIPYIHNLTKLAKFSGLYENMDNRQKDTLDFLDPLNIEARYPGAKEKLVASLTTNRCEEIILRTEDRYKWISKKF